MRRTFLDCDRNGMLLADRRGAIHRARLFDEGSAGAMNRAPTGSVA